MLIRYLFEHLGVVVFAITGALAARNKQVDLFGVVALALVTALGGGTLRDLILGTRPFWTVDVSFVFGATAAAAATFFAARFWEMPATTLLIADACGLALFTIIGTERALAFSASDTVAVVLGVMTGVAGGVSPGSGGATAGTSAMRDAIVRKSLRPGGAVAVTP